MLMPPLLVAPGVTITGLPTASWLGAPMASCMLRAALAKGRTLKLSPTLPAPESSWKLRPSNSIGNPVADTVDPPSDKRVTVTPPAPKLTS